MSEPHFLHGALRHPPLLAAVLGRQVEAVPALLPDHAEYVGPEGRSLALRAPGAAVPGLLVRLEPQEAVRLAYFEPAPDLLTVIGADGRPAPARGSVGAAADAPKDLPLWDFALWQRVWGALTVAAAGEYMALMDGYPRALAQARWPRMLARASARLRAAAPGPAELRRASAPGDVRIDAMGIGYAKFFSVEDYTLHHRRFGGGLLGPIERAAFISADAAVVLPYDPVRDRVLLIEQFRAGPMARGDANPWQLEAVAGLVDAGETPQETVLREAQEEAGVRIDRLIAAPNFYPSPGAKSEYLYTFIGIADLHDAAARPGGLAEEGEDIRPHLIPFARMMELLDSGEIDNAPLVVLALWLARQRAALRAGA